MPIQTPKHVTDIDYYENNSRVTSGSSSLYRSDLGHSLKVKYEGVSIVH